MNRAVAAARIFAWAAVVSALPVGLAACRGIVAGDATNFPVELCALLNDCDAGCAEDLLERVENASAAERHALLLYHDSVDCLASCAGARLCRDHSPICHPSGDACAASYDCCGSTTGAARCDAAASICCLALGAPCDSELCCDGEVCEENGRCGGFECTLTAEEVSDADQAKCTSSLECCSQRCEAGLCVANTCSPLGDACQVEVDCCLQANANGNPVQPLCQSGQCVDPTPDTCDVCLPVGDPELNCCLDTNQTCYVLPDGSSQCADSSCSPAGGDCVEDVDCCQAANESLYCNMLRCDPEAACATAEAPCVESSECCSQSCVEGVCVVPPACSETGAHSPCDIGPPLAPNGANTVVGLVCTEIPSCCCIWWEQKCVNRYRLHKPLACP